MDKLVGGWMHCLVDGLTGDVLIGGLVVGCIDGWVDALVRWIDGWMD